MHILSFGMGTPLTGNFGSWYLYQLVRNLRTVWQSESLSTKSFFFLCLFAQMSSLHYGLKALPALFYSLPFIIFKLFPQLISFLEASTWCLILREPELT